MADTRYVSFFGDQDDPLRTVGHYGPDGRSVPESDHSVAWLVGGGVP